jgi:hypothetical protein
MPGPSPSPSTPPTHAERTATDPYARWLGIELLELRPGYCRAALTVAPHMVKRAGFYTMIVKDDEDGTVVATCQAVSLRPAAHQPR